MANKIKGVDEAQMIGLRVRDARHRRGFSQRDLSARTGLDPVVISRLERGLHEPTLATLRKVARGLGCQTRDLI